MSETGPSQRGGVASPEPQIDSRIAEIARLAEKAAEAERHAAKLDEARRAALAEFKRLSTEAGRARSLHREAAAAADHARDDARGAREEWLRAVSAAYREWRLAHPGAPPSEHEQALRRLADACGMTMRDLWRAIGRRIDRRTPAEIEEDFERFKAGESIRSIARRRGLKVRAVQQSIHVRLVREHMAALRSVADRAMESDLLGLDPDAAPLAEPDEQSGPGDAPAQGERPPRSHLPPPPGGGATSLHALLTSRLASRTNRLVDPPGLHEPDGHAAAAPRSASGASGGGSRGQADT
jgi:hypothetical protein